MSLEVKLVSNFLVYLVQNCIKRSRTHPNDFRNSLWRNWKMTFEIVCDVIGKLIIYVSPMSLEVKLVSNFLVYLVQNCIKRSRTHPNDFRNSFFGTFPYIVKRFLGTFLYRSFMVEKKRWKRRYSEKISLESGCVFFGSEMIDSRKRTKLNGKVSDLPDRISSLLNVPLSNIIVGGYICNEGSYRDLKHLEKIL